MENQAESKIVYDNLTLPLVNTWYDMVQKGQSQPDSAWNYNEFHTGKTTGARLFFNIQANTLWICLPGVRTSGQVAGQEELDLLDFFLAPVKINNERIWVHSGFLACAKDLLPIIQYQISILPLNIENIIISGYSMGADIGSILYLLLRDEIQNTHRLNLKLLILGGSHILGWGQRKKLGDLSNVVSLRNDQDLVTHIPPKISPLGLYTEFVPFIQVGNYFNIFSSFRGIFDYAKNAHYYDNYFNNLKAKFFPK